MNHAEQMVYKALQPLENQGYKIFHSVRFCDDVGYKSDYEADLVVCGPQGFLVIEVKGGNIKWDSQRGTATSTDSSRRVHAIDPWKQGLENSYKILEHYNSFKNIHSLPYRIAHGFAVVFPDGKINFKSPTSLSGCQNTTWDQRHLDTLDTLAMAKLEQLATQTKATVESPIEVSHWEEFYFQFYDKSFKWEPARIIQRKMALGIAAEDLKLSQSLAPSLAASVPLNRVLLEGGPGTGKTALLSQKALEISSKNPEAQILYVCFNQMLSAEVERFFEAHNVNVIVWEFHKLCEFLVEEYCTSELSHVSKDTHYYTELLPQLTLEAIRGAENLSKVTHLFVDEAQDLVIPEFWEVLYHLHAQADEGFWWIAWDPRQCIFKSDLSHEECLANLRDSFPEDLTYWHLNLNIRNHPRINSYLHDSKIWNDPSGLNHLDKQMTKNIQVTELKQDSRLYRDKLQETLMEAKELRLESLRILSHHTSKNSLYDQLDLTKNSNSSSQPPGSDSLTDIQSIEDIPFCTIQKFKGCECDGIILLDFDRQLSQENEHRLFYLGVSRARLKVWVLW